MISRFNRRKYLGGLLGLGLLAGVFCATPLMARRVSSGSALREPRMSSSFSTNRRVSYATSSLA